MFLKAQYRNRSGLVNMKEASSCPVRFSDWDTLKWGGGLAGTKREVTRKVSTKAKRESILLKSKSHGYKSPFKSVQRITNQLTSLGLSNPSTSLGFWLKPVRIRVSFFLDVYFSRGTLPTKKETVKGHPSAWQTTSRSSIIWGNAPDF